MGFQENLLKKIEINRLADSVLQSIGPAESGRKVDKDAVRGLLDIGGYRLRRVREMDLYIQEPDTDPQTILVLDNDLPIYRTGVEDVALRKNPFIKEMLSRTGAEVVHAKNGREAIRLTREQGPDVVLMDLKMPEVSGIEATRTIRQFNTGVPIIAQTAFVMAEEKEESQRAGCNFFITKPLDRTELMEIIDNCFWVKP